MYQLLYEKDKKNQYGTVNSIELTTFATGNLRTSQQLRKLRDAFVKRHVLFSIQVKKFQFSDET